MGMNGRLLRPKASGHPEALAWRSAVTANGGTVSASTMTAVTAFCKSIDATAGLRACFYRLNLFCGTGLEACLVPLYRAPASSGTQYGNTTDTNSNFVSGDYTETGTSGGLVGNGSTKRLSTGLDALTAGISHDNTHHSWYSRAQMTANNCVIGAFGGGVGAQTWQSLSFGGLSQLFYRSGGASNCGLEGVTWSGANRSGHLIVLRGGSDAKLYRNGTDLNSTVTITNTTTWASVSPGSLFVFARNNSGTADQFLAATLQGYSVGVAMTAAQASAYYTAMQTFQTALGRNL
jgi:hypothetical protein